MLFYKDKMKSFHSDKYFIIKSKLLREIQYDSLRL